MSKTEKRKMDLMDRFPIIDFAKYRDGHFSLYDHRELATACEDMGFFLLKGHGLDELIAEVFFQSESFFSEDKTYKQQLCRDEDNPLGYFDRELTKRKRDQKEVFDFKVGGYQSGKPNRTTRWPKNRDGFKQCLARFFESFTGLSEEVIEMIFVSMGMEKSKSRSLVTASFGREHSSAARLNYYPAQDPVPETEREAVTPLGDMALHHHTDPGAITLLLQDDHGGLQAHSTQHGWIDVEPQAGTIVVNIGDVMQVWTNDRCKSGIHRVLPISSDRGRYSTPFFYQPRFDAVIEPWSNENEPAKYRSFLWKEFIRGRVSDNFADYGEEDIQIDRYRVA